MEQFPAALKGWRKARRLSQLDLANEASVSARHISFLEKGRARPSREMVERLAEALYLPLATRNQLLTQAGFAACYLGRSWEEEEMAPIRAALKYTLDKHSPYPAIAIDRVWTVVRMNETASCLFGPLGVSKDKSLLDLLVSDQLPNVIENWAEVAHITAQRLRTESTSQGGVPALDRTAAKLGEVAGSGVQTIGPVVPAIYKAGNLRLALFTTIAQFGTPVDLTLDDLKIELFFPADTNTERALQSMVDS